MWRTLRRVRLTELQLLITVLLFFAAGYVLVATTGQNRGLLDALTVTGVVDILWPSSLPLVLYLLVSAGLSYRSPDADQLLLPLVAVLSGFGLLLTSRLKPALDKFVNSETGKPIYGDVDAKQSLFVTAGVVLLVLMVFVNWDYVFIRLQRMNMMDWLKHHRWTWMIFGVLLMVATFAFGVDPNGSGVKVWFRLPGGLLFQPAELLKIILVIFLASYLNEHREVVAGGYRLGGITFPPVPYLVPMAGIWLLCLGLIVKQSDLGAALLLFGIFISMLYVSTGKAWYAAVSLLAFAGGSYVMYQFIGKVQERVAIWLNPWADANGVGYQIVQAQYALASGGVAGSGLGQGTPSFVPAVHTDFAFTAIGEELGLLGTIGVLVTYLLLVYRGYHIALSIPGRFRGFEQLLAIGLTTILAIQALIIVGGNLRVIPLTGITLPFVSYGGSSVLMNFIIVGLLLRISATSHKERV